MNATHDAVIDAYMRDGRIYRSTAYRILHDAALAEEVVQEVFLNFWRDPSRFDPARGTLRSLLITTVQRRSVDYLRAERARQGREVRIGCRDSRPSAPSDEAVLDLLRDEAVRAQLASLSRQQREPIQLAFYEGMSYREIATALGIPEGTIKSRIRAGLARLREELNQELIAA
ncbi:MAG TPA: sigma-70 family RNA polymerase sigma factor [Acidimicrobiia bacterium]|nr:sigma-70 family RNA polymerase sigma factor [Acidimicrobiia bacterium]